MDEYRLQDIWKKNLREFNDVMRLDSIIIKSMQEAQTEQLILSSVSQKRELLTGFINHYNDKLEWDAPQADEDDINEYLASL